MLCWCHGSMPQPTSPTSGSANAPGAAAVPDTGLARAVRAVFSVTLLSRFGGLIRDVIVARVFGDTWINSAFVVAFAIPNMFRRLFGEGALSAAFIPQYAAIAARDPAEAGRLATLTLRWLGIATGLITAVLEATLLVLLLVLPADPERELSLKLIMVMLPFMPFICAVAILAGMLQVHGKFAASSTGPLVLNGFMIAVGLWAILNGRVLDSTVAYVFGVATTLSGITQAWWFARLLRPHAKWAPAHECDTARPAAREMFRRFVPVLVGLGTLQLSAFLDQCIAMWSIWVGPTILGYTYPLDDASAGILNAAQRLYQFPLGVFGVAVATAVFPMLSRDAAADDGSPERNGGRFAGTLRRGVRLSLLLGIPASIGLVLVRHDLLQVLFAANKGSAGSGNGFSAAGIERASAVLMGYAPAVWAYALNHVLARAFYAKGDTLTPMRVSLVLVAINLALNCTLIWWLREAGLAWSTAITAAVQVCVLGWLLRGRFGAATLDRETMVTIAKILIASAVMTGACWGVLAAWPGGGVSGGTSGSGGIGGAGSWWMTAARLATTCGAGGVVFVAACAMLRVSELRQLVSRGAGRS